MKWLRRLAQWPIRLYRWGVSPFLGANCRFQPSCSAYAMQAIDRHGVVRGGLLAAGRILRCHPFSRACRHDPVPESFAWGHLIGYNHLHSGQAAKQDKT